MEGFHLLVPPYCLARHFQSSPSLFCGDPNAKPSFELEVRFRRSSAEEETTTSSSSPVTMSPAATGFQLGFIVDLRWHCLVAESSLDASGSIQRILDIDSNGAFS